MTAASPTATRPDAPVTYELASWGVRAAALALDLLVLAAVGMALAVGIVLFERDADDAQRLAQTLSYTVGLPLGLLYAPLLMTRRGARNGQTLGKQAMGIRVVREDGEPMTFGAGLLRDTFGRQLLAIVTYGLYAIADYLWPLWDGNRQCLHDKIGKTRVVRVEPADADPRDIASDDLPLAAPPPSAPPPPSPNHERPVRDGWLPPLPGR